MDREIWQWTLTKEAIAPCFVRDVLAMRQSNNDGFDFFWLGHTPCRTVLLVGMVVGIQVYDRRTIYTIDDGTAVIDCVLRHPRPTFPEQRSPTRSTEVPSSKPNPQRPSPKKAPLDKGKLESAEPPPPITEPGYPVRVIGRIVRHFQSRQVYADAIDPCPSSVDEIVHLERIIDLHKTKYCLATPFVPPPKGTSHTIQSDTSKPPPVAVADASVFSNASPSVRSSTDIASYALPPPPVPQPLQNRSRTPSGPPIIQPVRYDHTHIPSSPTASSIASSTPSSPCKSSSPIKAHEVPCKPKLRHPSRLHTRDLTGNTFRLYVKHYMDNAPPPFPTSLSSPLRSTCGEISTPTKRTQDKGECGEPTPRPRTSVSYETRCREWDENDGATLGFTLSHLRRVPELALLAARVVRSEARKREKADREKQRGNPHTGIPSASSGAVVDPSRQKMKRLFRWAIVKLHEEGSIIIWDGDVRPLPVPPDLEGDRSGLWKEDDTRSTFGALSASPYATSTLADLSTSTSGSVLYTSSASASLYSHYHPPRQSTKRGQADGGIDVDADPGYVSDPVVDEDAYVPLTPRLLAVPVRDAVAALRGRCNARSGKGTEPTPEDILTYLRRTNDRWVRVGVWAVEEALALL